MKKGKINPNFAKFISSLFIAFIFIAISFTIINISVKQTIRHSEDNYYETMNVVLSSYTQAVSQHLEKDLTALKSFYVDEILTDGNPQTISKFLQKYNYKKDNDFDSIYYLDKNGTAYFSNGIQRIMDLSNHKILTEDIPFDISPRLFNEENSTYIFGIEIPVYDSNHEIKGTLCASVNLENFNKSISKIKLQKNCNFNIIDNTGTIIYSSSDFFNNNDDENILLSEKLGLCDWKIYLLCPTNDIKNVYLKQNKAKFKIILLSVLIIFILVFIEQTVLDIFQRKQLFTTYYDSLTNLWTRQHFENEATRQLRTFKKSKFMLIEADIRGFKFINETYGEEAADKVIVFYANTLSKYAKDFHAILGRGFADRFYILLKVHSVSNAMTLFKERIEAFTSEMNDFEVPFFPKFGISFLLPENSKRDVTIQGLIGQASFAKSTIKDNVLTQYSVYNSKLLEKINEERFIEENMQQGIDKNEFFVMYQPKIDLKTEKIVGAEALVRWNNPKLGLLTPDKFIPLFERNGFITKLDFYVYNEVFKFIETQILNGLPAVPISINMSRNHNKVDRFIKDFLDLFHKYSIPANLIQLEIIERSVMDNETLREITEKLHKEGFTVAMDDFGSGESSLNMLTKIPVDVLKFDRDFLLSATNEDGSLNEKSSAFIKSLIDLSKVLDKQTVFEGVESQEQKNFLKSVNCDQVQGYFYSRPLSMQDYVQYLKLHV